MFKQLGQRLSFCSRDLNKALGFQSTFGGAGAYDDLAAALENPDISSCVICLPHDLHEPCVDAVVAARRHVLLEKPIAHTMASAERIARLAATLGGEKAFMLAEQMEYLPVLANVRRLAQPMRYRFTDRNTYEPRGWRGRVESSGGGVLLDLGIHYVSFAVKAFGPIASHRKETRQLIPNTSVPFDERVFIRHAGGVEGEVDVAWLQPANERLMTVASRSSTLEYRPGGRFATLGGMPQLVALRARDGREQMVEEYLSRCRSPRPASDIADALPILAAVL